MLNTKQGIIFEAGDKVLIVPARRLATVLDVYGDGSNGDHGDIRLDVSGNTALTDVEPYDASKHGAFDHTFVPIRRKWKEFYGISKDVELRKE